MRCFVITSPAAMAGEAKAICRLLDAGVEVVHLRKPQAGSVYCERLIGEIPPAYYKRLVIHDYHELALKYSLLGIHLNVSHPIPPAGYGGWLSRSCHSLDEVVRYKAKLNYVFLSPIFDSISKQGYQSTFTSRQLDAAACQGIVDEKVVALGGVTLKLIPLLLRWHFGGAAFLGEVWQSPAHLERFISCLHG